MRYADRNEGEGQALEIGGRLASPFPWNDAVLYAYGQDLGRRQPVVDTAKAVSDRSSSSARSAGFWAGDCQPRGGTSTAPTPAVPTATRPGPRGARPSHRGARGVRAGQGDARGLLGPAPHRRPRAAQARARQGPREARTNGRRRARAAGRHRGLRTGPHAPQLRAGPHAGNARRAGARTPALQRGPIICCWSGRARHWTARGEPPARVRWADPLELSAMGGVQVGRLDAGGGSSASSAAGRAVCELSVARAVSRVSLRSLRATR